MKRYRSLACCPQLDCARTGIVWEREVALITTQPSRISTCRLSDGLGEKCTNKRMDFFKRPVYNMGLTNHFDLEAHCPQVDTEMTCADLSRYWSRILGHGPLSLFAATVCQSSSMLLALRCGFPCRPKPQVVPHFPGKRGGYTFLSRLSAAHHLAPSIR